MGFAGFDFRSPAEIFDEYCRLTGFRNDGRRALDLSGLAGMGARGYETMEPVQWPVLRPPPPGDGSAGRLFAAGGFFTQDRRARFVPVRPRAPASKATPEYPLILNTGRIRDQWHTMTRTGKTPRLLTRHAEPFIDMHPRDAARYGIVPGSITRVESADGAVMLRARISDRVGRGQAFAPIHWTDELAARARVDSLVAAHTDPVSGQPEFKITPIRVTPFGAAWYAFGVVRARPAPDRNLYWAAAPVDGGWRIELAGRRRPDDWAELAGKLAGCDGEDTLALNDPAMGVYRLAIFDRDRLRAALFVSREPVALSRSWAIDLLSRTFPRGKRLEAVAASHAASNPDGGAIVCACMRVAVSEIAAAVARGARTVAEIGSATGAGTDCGSCRTEIRQVIDAHRLQAAE